MGLEMGSKTFNMGIEGDKIEFISKWLGSPSMALLGMPSLNSSSAFLGMKGR